LRIVEVFTELNIISACVIAALACSLSVIALICWKEA
jgi:hypothetical protein